jgi:hypothetical protein
MKTTKILVQDSRCPGRYLSLEPPEYGVLITFPWRSVLLQLFYAAFRDGLNEKAFKMTPEQVARYVLIMIRSKHFILSGVAEIGI